MSRTTVSSIVSSIGSPCSVASSNKPCSHGWGERDCNPGIYRDPVRSSQGAFCENQWSAMVEFDAVGAGALGTAGVGATISDGVVSVRALLSRARSDPRSLTERARQILRVVDR